MNTIQDDLESIDIVHFSLKFTQTLKLDTESKIQLVLRYYKLFRSPDLPRKKAEIVNRIILLDNPPDGINDDEMIWAENVREFLVNFEINPPPGYLFHIPRVRAHKDEISQSVTAENRPKPSVISNVRKITEDAEKLEKGYRRGLYGVLESMYAQAEILRINPSEWKLFTSAPEWTDRKNPPRPEDPASALQYVIRFVYGMNSTEGNQRANKFSRALKPLFTEGVPASEIVSRIENLGGLEKMSKPSAQMSSKLIEVSTKVKAIDDDLFGSSELEDSKNLKNTTVTANIKIGYTQYKKLRSMFGKFITATILVEGGASIPIRVKFLKRTMNLNALNT